MNILDFIPYGKNNAISRQELVMRTGMTDRAIRRAIQLLREDGEIILSSSHGKGYWRSDEVSEIAQYIRENDSRCRKMSRTNRKIKEKYYTLTGQRYTTVKEHIRRVGICKD